MPVPSWQTAHLRNWLFKPRTVWSYFPFLFLALVTLTLTIISARVLWVWPYDGMRWSTRTGYVRDVDPSGPAAQVGIQPGDQVLALDGVSLNQVFPIYHHKRAGDRVLFTLKRAEQVVMVSLTLATPPLREHLIRLEPLLVALAFWGIGLVVWALCPFHGVSRLFFALSQAVAGMLAVGGLSAFRIPWALWLFNLLLLLLAPLALHFYACFPDAPPPRYRRPLLRLAYGAGSFLAVVSIIWPRPLASPTVPQWLWTGIRSFVALVLLVALALLLRRRKGPLPLHQRRRLLIAGMAFSLLPLLLFSFLPELVRSSPVLDYVWTFPLLILLPLSYGYAVRRGELGKVDFILNRSLVYLTLTLMLAGFYLLVSALLGYLGAALGGRFLPGQPLREALVVALVAGVAAVTFYPLRDRVQHWMDYLFYGGWYDYQTVVQETVRKLTTVATLPDVARILLDEVATAMKLRCACLVLANEPINSHPLTAYSLVDSNQSLVSGCFVSATPGNESCPLQSDTPPSLLHNGVLARILATASAPLDLDWKHLQQAVEGRPLSEAEQVLLICPHARLLTPLRQGQELLGVLLLGSRLGDEPLFPHDQAIIETVARHTAVVMENLILLEREHQWATEVKALQSRLIEAREEERKQVARDLHDEVLQDLTTAYRMLGDWHHLSPEAAKQRLEEVGQCLYYVIKAVRRICSEQRSPVLDVLGLADAVQAYAKEFENRTGIAVRVIVKGNDQTRFPEQVEVCLFRVFQEALRNVEKHAGATKVDVALEIPPNSIQPGAVVLTVRDNGCGFELSPQLGTFINRGCFGLVGMRERLAMVGGQLILSSSPGRGTRLVARVPITTSEEVGEQTGY